MADARDYLEMRGDITLAERPFNDCDNVALATFAYLDLRGIAPGAADSGSVSVSEACRRFMERAGGDDIAAWVRSLAAVDARFVLALGASERFGASCVRSYVDAVDEERVLQFSALCIDLDDGHTYVAFRGTDSSLVGWREDFMLSFQVTEAQRAAAAYLESEARTAQCEGRSLYVGGHSKGGILAEYACAVLPEELRGVVDHVWSDDGPGMTQGAVPVPCAEVYGKRFTHVVPEYGIVGMLFDDGSAKKYVKSSATGATQHDPLSWQMGAKGLIEAEGLLPEARRMDDALAGWISGIEPDERERFTDELFGVLGAGGATTLAEVTGSLKSVQAVAQALAGSDQRTRDLVWELLGAAIGANIGSAKDAVAAYAARLLQK